MSEEEKKPAWAQWDIQQAWLDVVAARESGDTEAEALGMQRFSEGLRNSAMGAAGGVVMPLDKKIDGVASLLTALTTEQRRIDNESQNRVTYFYNQMGAFLKDADARFKSYDAVFVSVQEALSRLGGLEARVERVEVGQAKLEIRVEAVETQGAPAKAVDELHHLRTEIKEVRSLLILTRRQLWLTWIPVACFVLLVVISIIARGGQ